MVNVNGAPIGYPYSSKYICCVLNRRRKKNHTGLKYLAISKLLDVHIVTLFYKSQEPVIEKRLEVLDRVTLTFTATIMSIQYFIPTIIIIQNVETDLCLYSKQWGCHSTTSILQVSYSRDKSNKITGLLEGTFPGLKKQRQCG